MSRQGSTIADVVRHLEDFAPPVIAADWDNVGLLVGDPESEVRRVMTCLTLTPQSVREAVDEQAGLVVAHHPLPFRALKRITTNSHEGRLLWSLARAGVAIHSPHTAFDSCAGGINEQLAEALGLRGVEPLEALAVGGLGRVGALPQPITAGELALRVKRALGVERLQLVARDDQPCRQVAVACGSGGDLLGAAIARGCDAFLTGEARFHTCLEAEAAGVALLLPGHYATERPGVEWLAQRLAAAFPSLHVWASRAERDPVTWV